MEVEPVGVPRPPRSRSLVSVNGGVEDRIISASRDTGFSSPRPSSGRSETGLVNPDQPGIGSVDSTFSLDDRRTRSGLLSRWTTYGPLGRVGRGPSPGLLVCPLGPVKT